MAMTNALNLPQPFVDAVSRSYTYKPNRYSVTRILGDTCEAILTKRHADEIGGDVADAVWAVFGSAVHKILEQSKETDSQLKENWLSVQVGDYELSGIFDLYDADTKTVTDWKTASVWKVKFGDFEDWRRQTLIYCWMLRQNGFDAENGEIVAMLKDHSKREARLKASEGYPPHPVYVKRWHFCENEFVWAEKYVNTWFEMVRVQEQLEDGYLTPCSEKARWHKDDKWAVMKKGTKRALRLFDNEAGANIRATAENVRAGKNLHYVEFRRGEDTKCEGYCDVAQWCPYWNAVAGKKGE